MTLSRMLTAVPLVFGLVFGASVASGLTVTNPGTCSTASVTGSTECAGVFLKTGSGKNNDSEKAVSGFFGQDTWTKVMKWEADKGFEDGKNPLGLKTTGAAGGTWSVERFGPYESVMFVLKGSTSYSAFLMSTDVLGGLWDNKSFFTVKNDRTKFHDISHWTVYGVEAADVSEVPLPAAGFLLAAGLGALALRGRRRKN